MNTKFEIITKYNAGDKEIIKLRCLVCGKECSYNYKHYIENQVRCNTCSYNNYKEEEHFYIHEEGLKHKKDIYRKCRSCRESDQMINLIPVQKETKSGLRFYLYHEKCLKKEDHTPESKQAELNNKELNEIKNKEAKKRAMFKYTNLRRIQNRYGIEVENNLEITLLNRTCFEIDKSLKIPCIYSIKNNINNKRYIGSTFDLRHRILTHLRELKTNKHHSEKLQEDWNTYNTDNFHFEILELLHTDNKEHKAFTEQKYIDITDSFFNGYNSNPIAGFIGDGKTCIDTINSVES